MKSLLLIGGVIGFAIGLVFSWAEHSSGAACIWHACLAAYLSSALMRWWCQTWRHNLEDALRERHSSTPPINLSKANKS